jgi:hypothetical protein
MKAPLLLGNDIRKMDEVALGVVKNKDALNISQDSLGIQAQRVWSARGPSSLTDRLNPDMSAAAVAAPCRTAQSTQVWQHVNGVLATTDADGRMWCVRDVEGSEEVGSWRASPCDLLPGTVVTQETTQGTHAVRVRTSAGGYLTANTALGASGPVAHTRYIATDGSKSPSSMLLRQPAAGAGKNASASFRLVVDDGAAVRDDDKAGTVAPSASAYCFDLAQDADSEVWAGSLSSNRWAVALLNRDPLVSANITVSFSMFNMTASSTFQLRDIWAEKDIGPHTGSYTSTVAPQGVAYLLLTPGGM